MTTTAVLAPYTVQQFFYPNGTPLAGGLLTTYAAGTSTPIATYTNAGGATQNTNPIVLNTQGQASIWLLPNVYYKFALTDANGNNIQGYPVDNISVAQLLTLYGGVDTGAANAYILSFTASFSSLTNGIVIYWVPANTNTGASTINVNGLGVVNIVNQNGGALSAGQIVAGQMTEIIYYNGSFQLFSNSVFVSGVTKLYIKGSNTAISSSATLAIDPDLQVSLPAGSYSYEFGINFYSNAASNGGIALQASLGGNAIAPAFLAFSNVNGTGAVQAVSGNTGSIYRFPALSRYYSMSGFATDSLWIKGTFTITSLTVLSLYWAQDSSSTGNAVVTSGSYLTVTSGSVV